MPIDDGEVVVIVLLTDKTAGVLAESAHLILERQRIADELGLVQYLIDLLHDLISHLKAHPDVDGAGLMVDGMVGADVFEPVGPSAASGHNDGVGIKLLFTIKAHAETFAVLDHKVETFTAE